MSLEDLIILNERLDALTKDLEKANQLLQEFLAHHKARKITNGFHDLLAKDIKKYLNNKGK